MTRGGAMIWLVRHAQAQGAQGLYIGSTDLPLSDEGQNQARALAQGMAGLGLKALYSSPLRRAQDTAAPLARACGLATVNLVPELAEIHMGSWEGLSMEEIRQEQPEAHAARGRDFAGFRTPGGETFAEVAVRALRGLAKMAGGPRPCAVVTHAGVIRVLLCHVCSFGLNELFRFKPDPAHAWGLEPNGPGWSLRHENLSAGELASLADQPR